jgi:membrane protease YdiL (CAAX protease family)
VPWGVPEALFVLFLFMVLQVAFSGLVGAGVDGLTGRLVVAASSEVSVIIIVLLAAHSIVPRQAGGLSSTVAALGLTRPAAGSWKGAGMAIAAGVAAYIGATSALHAGLDWFGLDWQDLPQQPLSRMVMEAEGWQLIAGAVVAAVVLAPLAEELLFRSVLYLPLRARLGPLAAAAVVGLLFSGFHAYLPGIAHLFILSLVFTALFERTGSLWVPIAAHALYNGLRLVLLRMGGPV